MTAPLRSAESRGQTLEQTYRTERRRMLGYLAWRIGRDAAPDLLQEIFTRAAGTPNAANIENPKLYVWKIMRNLLIERYRQEKRCRPIFVPFDEQRDPPTAADQALQIEANDLLRLYGQALDRMSPKTRRVFLMSRVEHRTYREISEEIGIKVVTVDYHMIRALRELRKSLTID